MAEAQAESSGSRESELPRLRSQEGLLEVMGKGFAGRSSWRGFPAKAGIKSQINKWVRCIWNSVRLETDVTYKVCSSTQETLWKSGDE